MCGGRAALHLGLQGFRGKNTPTTDRPHAILNPNCDSSFCVVPAFAQTYESVFEFEFEKRKEARAFRLDFDLV
jgi:hypothetical protein